MPKKISLASATPISLDDTKLWPILLAASSGKKIGFFKTELPSGGPLYIVNMNQSVKMMPFVRVNEELFEDTARRESTTNKFKVVINGPTYGLTNTGKFDALIGKDPVSAAETLQEGYIIKNRKIIGGCKSNMYFIANYVGSKHKFRFGKGTAPESADAALGNMGPLLINGLPFGVVNKYAPYQADAKKIGAPCAKHQPFLIQRSNARFNTMISQPDIVGKIAIGYKIELGQLLILIQPHGTTGVSIAGLREIAFHIGLHSAVYLDGSDSVMLMIDNKIIIPQGSNKNETTITGIGFVY